MNSWLIDNGARLLGMPFNAAVSELRERTARLAVRSDEKIEKQQFSTPPILAYLADRALSPRADDSVLEPSGGIGGLVSIVKTTVASVHVNEIDPERRGLAESVGFKNTSGQRWRNSERRTQRERAADGDLDEPAVYGRRREIA